MMLRRCVGVLVAGLIVGSAFAQVEAAAEKKAKKPYFWFAMWPDKITQYDPDTDEVV